LQATRRHVRIVHTADFHLDNDGYGNAREQEAYRVRSRASFCAVIDHAVEQGADLLLVAGDMFDHNRVSDETVGFVQSQFRRLQRPVVVLPGNHDCLYPNSVYDRYDLSGACENVRVITALHGQAVEFPELDLVVWGRAMEEHAPGFRPLEEIPSRQGDRWHVAMAHGFFYESGHSIERASPILAQEIRDCGWDYLALGHQHVLSDVSQGQVKAYYSGAPLNSWIDRRPAGYVVVLDLSPETGVSAQAQEVVIREKAVSSKQ